MEYSPKHIFYSNKQHLFLAVYVFSGSNYEVVLYWENTDSQPVNHKGNTVKGTLPAPVFVLLGKLPNTMHGTLCDWRHLHFCLLILVGRDAAFIGPGEN